VLTQLWDKPANAWINSHESISVYNTNHKIVRQHMTHWQAATGAWLTTLRHEYFYDVAGINKIADSSYIWDGPKSAWQNSYVYRYTHTPSGKDDVILIFNWNSTRQAYDTIDRHTYTYDGADNYTRITRERWSRPQQKFNNFEQHQFTYNSFNQKTSQSIYQWNTATGGWKPTSSYFRYYYEPYNTAASVSGTSGSEILLQLRPNPVSSYIEVDVSSVKAHPYPGYIADMQGRIQRTFAGNTGTGNSIEVSGLPTGQYLISIHGASGPVSRMFSIAR
jgi:hypothetical protein